MTADRSRLPSAAYLNSRLNYNPITGELHWNPRYDISKWALLWNGRFAGKLAGGIDKDLGYRTVGVCDCLFLAHHIIWKMTFGEDAPDQIDHIDGDRANNRLSNLRAATELENKRNHGLSKRNKTGHTGIHKHRSRWLARLSTKALGSFATKAEAIVARRLAEQSEWGDFARK